MSGHQPGRTFGVRLRAALDDWGPLCVGIDPHPGLLDAWSLPQSARGVRELGLRTVDAAAGRVGTVKTQVSFFERFGSAGFAALEDVLAAARGAGLIVIADAKRGDIGSTNEGYADAWLTAGSPLEADALTLSPYLGAGALRPLLERAISAEKGVFVLAATSNPEGEGIQRAHTASGTAVARAIVAELVAPPSPSLRPFGVVIGATVDRNAYGLDDAALDGLPILAPGFGAQGATPEDLPLRFGAVALNVVASESRSILDAGPEGIVAAVAARAERYREVRGG